jgi:hypothetical protein
VSVLETAKNNNIEIRCLYRQNVPSFKIITKYKQRLRTYFWALKSFMTSRNMSYFSFWSWNMSFTSFKYDKASLVVSFWEVVAPPPPPPPITSPPPPPFPGPWP